MKTLLIGTVVVAALSLGACSNSPAKATSASAYDKVVAEAKAQHAKSKSMGNSWKQKKMKKPYVDTFLAKAAAAKEKGDDEKALKLANKALFTANAQVVQITNSPKPAWIK